MLSFGFILFVLATTSATLFCQRNNDDIKILHVIFRHGDRTPIDGYPNDPYKNVVFPRGPGELTLNGKKRAYKLGKILGCRYEEILSKRPYYEMLKATSSEYNRTRETLLSVLAGMFPPGRKDRISPNVNWQPISPNYMKFTEDKLLAFQEVCPNNIFDTSGVINVDPLTWKIFKDIERKTGSPVSNFKAFVPIRDYLSVMNELGFPIAAWAQPYWPQPLQLFCSKGWHEMYDNNLGLIVGNLLHKIAEDSMQHLARSDRRVYLYSGHDVNVGALLDALGAFANQTINYTAFVAFEVIEVEGQRRVLVYHDNHDEMETYLEIPGCGYDCSVEDFMKFVQKFYLGDKWCT